MSKANRLAKQDRVREKRKVELKTTVQHVLDNFNITNWDYLLLGDGSGSSWGRPIGWACVLVERRTWTGIPFCGAANDGTVNFAELMAYLMPLTYIDTKKVTGQVVNVHVITDSEYTQQNSHRLTPDKNAGLIGGINAFRRKGICTTFHWMRRNTHPLTTLADELSKEMRKLVKVYNEDNFAEINQKINQVLADGDE